MLRRRRGREPLERKRSTTARDIGRLERHAEPLEQLAETPLRLAQQILVAEHVLRAAMLGERGLDDLRPP